MRLGILPEALKQRDDPMLIRQELVKLIEAWPDESGVSSDPEAYNAWMEIEKNILASGVAVLQSYLKKMDYFKGQNLAQCICRRKVIRKIRR